MSSPLCKAVVFLSLLTVCHAENNQAGVDSPGYTPGPYSEEAEILVLRFVDWYCAKAAEYLDEQLAKDLVDAA